MTPVLNTPLATFLQASILSLSLVLTGCGSSSSAPDITEEQADTRSGLVDQEQEGLKSATGSFVDSPVSGIYYNTGTFSGLTDSAGRFEYIVGEVVEFSIGNLTLGAAVANETITPLELGSLIDGQLSYQNNHQDRATNTLRLLQSLDSDGYPDNGIVITENTRLAINDIEPAIFIALNIGADEFEQQQALIQLLSLTTNSGTLVTSERAIAHFKETLAGL